MAHEPPIDRATAKQLAQLADRIRDVRELMPELSAQDALKAGRLLDEMQALVTSLIARHGEPTKRIR